MNIFLLNGFACDISLVKIPLIMRTSAENDSKKIFL